MPPSQNKPFHKHGEVAMYKDFFPDANGPVEHVAVVTRNERVRPEAVIACCKSFGAVSEQSEGTCFWIVFEDEPGRAWPFTQEGLRTEAAGNNGYVQCQSFRAR